MAYIEYVKEEYYIMDKTYFTTQEAASYIGCKLSYFYRLVSQKKFAKIKPNGCKTFFLKADLDNYMMAGYQHSAKELEDIAAESMKRG